MAKLNLGMRASGIFPAVQVLKNGELVREIRDCKNLITNSGMEMLASSDRFPSFLRVGAGSAEPRPTDTALASQLASKSGAVTNAQGQNVEEGYAFMRAQWLFPEGAVVGNVSELGIASNASSGPLFNRALIRDVNGQPTSITVLSDEQLRVVWEYRVYWPKTDSVVKVVNEADESEVYTCTARPIFAGSWFVGNANTGFFYGRSAGMSRSTGNSSTGGKGTYIPGPYALREPDGVHQSIRGVIGPNLSRAEGGQGYVVHRASLALNEANDAQGIGGVILCYGGTTNHSNQMKQYFQIKFDPPIPKTAKHKLEIDVKLSWSRADVP